MQEHEARLGGGGGRRHFVEMDPLRQDLKHDPCGLLGRPAPYKRAKRSITQRRRRWSI